MLKHSVQIELFPILWVTKLIYSESPMYPPIVGKNINAAQPQTDADSRDYNEKRQRGKQVCRESILSSECAI